MKQLHFVLIIYLTLAFLSCKTADQTACIDTTKINPDMMCTMQYDPVCGCNNQTYGNACVAQNAGVTSFTKGACQTDN